MWWMSSPGVGWVEETLIGHFTVVYLVAKPLIWSEAEGDQYLVSMITK